MTARQRKSPDKPDPPGSTCKRQDESICRRKRHSKKRTTNNNVSNPCVVVIGVFASVIVIASIYSLWLRRQQNGGQDSFLQEADERHDDQCSIYIAPSSLQGSDGFGLYTARDFAAGEPLLKAPDGPSIAVIDHMDGEHQKQDRRQWSKVFGEYWWGRGVSSQVSFEGDSVMDFQILFGSLPNHHCILDTLTYTWPEYSNYGLNRFQDAGAGAISYHSGRSFTTKRALRAGEEIFLNYGYCGEDEDERSKAWTHDIVRTHHYSKAASLVKRATLETSKLQQDEVLKRIQKAAKGQTDQVRSILPKTKEQLARVMTTTGDTIKDVALQLALEIGSTPRSGDWVRQHGVCLDNLVPGPSTIPQAGRGAIAQRPLSKGDVVVPVPLLQIMNREALAMYDDDGNQNGYQLLLNYCFGHRDSTLLLCPTTNAILINHCSEGQQCGSGNSGPNAYYKWATEWDPQVKEWLDMPLTTMAKQPGRGLALEIVALRDIAPGEEVFLDYGQGWQEAWDEHVANWKPPRPDGGFAHYTNPVVLNEGPAPEFLVTNDLRVSQTKLDPQTNVLTGCLYWVTELDTTEAWVDLPANPDWKELSDEEILNRYADDGSFYEGAFEQHRDGAYWKCSVIRPVDGSNRTRYIVRIDPPDDPQESAWEMKQLPRFLTNYPASSIHYFNKPYRSDQFLPGAFRHPIEIRDKIFPALWKNNKRRHRHRRERD